MKFKIFGRDITLFDRKAAADMAVAVPGSRSFWGMILESFAGAWQSNVVADGPRTMMESSGPYSCISLLSGDVSKMRIKLKRQDKNNSALWTELTKEADSPFFAVLRKPNRYQTRIKFLENWIVSKLVWGNTYILKARDARGMVRALYILDPCRVVPLVTPDGGVYYALGSDYLSGLREDVDVVVPASEIIHDRAMCLWHPLVGIAPITAAALSATQANRIQQNSAQFFQNMSRPSGVLTGPGEISDTTAARLKTAWETNFSGNNMGRVAVLGDDLKYTAMSQSAEQAQMIDQLKWTLADIARPFHIPLFKLGGDIPAGQTAETLNLIYYSDALQPLIECVEVLLDEGLGLPADLTIELDVDSLSRLDSKARYERNGLAIKDGWMAPNEARLQEGYMPVAGGDSPMIQQQNYSLAALAKRDMKDNPFESGAPALPKPVPPPTPAPAGAEAKADDEAEDEVARLFIDGLRKDSASDMPTGPRARELLSLATELAHDEAERIERIEDRQSELSALVNTALDGQKDIVETLMLPVIPEFHTEGPNKGRVKHARRKKKE